MGYFSYLFLSCNITTIRLLGISSICYLVVFAYPASVNAGEKVVKPYLGTAPLYQMIADNSRANLIFFSGGPGWWGNLKSKNLLVRERKNFFKRGANIFLFPNAEKKLKMSYADRLEDSHINRIRALVREIRKINNLPIFLVGMSRGTVSVGEFGSQFGNEIDGVILISGIYYNSAISKRNPYSMQTVIGKDASTSILIIHHENDGCKVCQPASAKTFFEELLVNNKKLVLISGGGSSGNPHGPFHHHGFEGVEDMALSAVIDWIHEQSR